MFRAEEGGRRRGVAQRRQRARVVAGRRGKGENRPTALLTQRPNVSGGSRQQRSGEAATAMTAEVRRRRRQRELVFVRQGAAAAGFAGPRAQCGGFIG
jgi:hypothetical protein